MHAVVSDKVTHRYGDRVAVDSVSFHVGSGEIFGLLGPNGGGKSTLFRILSTLLPLQSGSLTVFGCDVDADPDAVRSRVGVTFQSPSLDLKLTVAENLRCHGMLLGLSGAALRNALDRVCEQLGITDRMRDRAESLSGGLRRRVEVAKALVAGPALLLLDEPAAGLDPGARISMWEVLEELRSRHGVTVFLTTHLMEEAQRCDRIGILDRGQLVAIGAPNELQSSIGGECLTLSAPNLEELASNIRQQFDVEVRMIGGRLRIESDVASELLPVIAGDYRDRIGSISLAKPTLEDVFIHRTGRAFDEASG